MRVSMQYTHTHPHVCTWAHTHTRRPQSSAPGPDQLPLLRSLAETALFTQCSTLMSPLSSQLTLVSEAKNTMFLSPRGRILRW